jgi:hypothetical protein
MTTTISSVVKPRLGFLKWRGEFWRGSVESLGISEVLSA